MPVLSDSPLRAEGGRGACEGVLEDAIYPVKRPAKSVSFLIPDNHAFAFRNNDAMNFAMAAIVNMIAKGHPINKPRAIRVA